MDNIWLIKVLFTDEATYSCYETVGICTDEIEADRVKEEAEKEYPKQIVFIEKTETNQLLYLN